MSLLLEIMDATDIKKPSLPHYTCITCRVAFQSADIQRSHYKTDWHRYNLKRKVAELPPVSAETFQEKVLAQREAVSAAAASKGKQEVCETCRKHFTSQNSYQSHLRSRKHREMAMKQKAQATQVINEKSASKCASEEDADSTHKEEEEEEKKEVEEEEVLSDSEPEPLELTECLFCPHESKTMEESLSHMAKAHGFFIPDLDYLVDLKGLISYLCEKVGVAYMCLYCNDRGKSFYSVESVQQHMTNKCHCKIFFEGDASLEYAEYYDYSKSYPDHTKLKDTESDDPEEAVALPETNVEVNEDLELVLPSGSRLGHRVLRHYYKQRLPTQEQRKCALVSRLMSQYRALGWRENYGRGESGALRQRDEMWSRRMRSARDMKLSVKANKFQPHFRPQVVF